MLAEYDYTPIVWEFLAIQDVYDQENFIRNLTKPEDLTNISNFLNNTISSVKERYTWFYVLCQNENISVELMIYLIDLRYHNALLWNKKVPTHILEYIEQCYKGVYDIDQMISHPNMTSELLDKIFLDKEIFWALQIVKSPLVSEKLLIKIASTKTNPSAASSIARKKLFNKLTEKPECKDWPVEWMEAHYGITKPEVDE